MVWLIYLASLLIGFFVSAGSIIAIAKYGPKRPDWLPGWLASILLCGGLTLVFSSLTFMVVLTEAMDLAANDPANVEVQGASIFFAAALPAGEMAIFSLIGCVIGSIATIWKLSKK